MGTENQDTATLDNAGANQDESAKQAAEAAAATAAADTEGAGEQTEEEKQAAATKAAEEEAAKQAAEAKKSDAQKIGRTIRDLKKERREAFEKAQKAEIEKARLEGELEALKKYGLKPGESQPDPNAAPVRPKLEAFETVAEYNEALLDYTDKLTDWKVGRAEEAHKKELEAIRGTVKPAETLEQRRARETGEKIQTTLGKLNDEFGEETVEAITNMPLTEFSESMRDIILNKPENSTKLLKAIADNPDLGKKIAAMPVFDQVREIDKLEVAISARKTTNAPPPVSGVPGTSRPAPKTISEARSSEERFAIWEREKSEGR